MKPDKVNALIIDNNKEITDLLKEIMTRLGFGQIIVANNAYDGTKAFLANPIHIIILDWHLKTHSAQNRTKINVPIQVADALNGNDLVGRIRRSPKSPNPFVPVIMFTDPMNKKQFIAARDMGVNEIITKPLSVQALCDRMIHMIDSPRPYVTADSFKGPCRRHKKGPPPQKENRKTETRIIRYDESRKLLKK